MQQERWYGQTEILAPAGDAECAQAAIRSGANAIYLGYSAYSARQNAGNFDKTALEEILIKAHLCDVKVYVAMNTIVKDSEKEDFIQTLLAIWSLGVDAIILQDPFLGKYIHENYPQIVLHLSTQAGVCHLDGAKFAKECGFSRVILARETPLDEIARIASFIETEVFIQGALCTCFSGQCYFSSFAGGNSGNRGRCKQPCRKLYTYDRAGFTEKSYALSLSDLSVGEDIAKLQKAGVVSFKIEGRMRRAEYVAAAVAYYQALLNNNPSGQALSDLKRTYNRGNYTKGLAFGQDKKFLSPLVQGHMGEKIGVVNVRNGKYFVESGFTPNDKDAFKILREGKEVGGAVFATRERRGFTISSRARLKNGDGVFITTDTAVNTRLLQGERRGKIQIRLRFTENEHAIASWNGMEIRSQEIFTQAQKHALTEEEIRVCFLKTDGMPIDVEFLDVQINGEIFAPKAQMNAFRRLVYERIFNAIQGGRDLYSMPNISVTPLTGKNEKTAVLASDFNGLEADIAIYKPKDFSKPLPESFLNGNFEKYIYYPAFLTEKDRTRLLALIQEGNLSGIYADNYGGVIFAKENNVKLFAGTGFNLLNSLSITQLLQQANVEYYALSKEANEKELALLTGEKAFTLACGDIKIMDLIYCPFSKTCGVCDKKDVYTLTDENAREFPIRRYQAADGSCRFEAYNCAKLIGSGVENVGRLIDVSISNNAQDWLVVKNDEAKQKTFNQNYTSGHFRRGIL